MDDDAIYWLPDVAGGKKEALFYGNWSAAVRSYRQTYLVTRRFEVRGK